MFRAILARVVHFAQTKPKPTPLKFPVALRLKYPSWDVPGSAEFSSAEEIPHLLPRQPLLTISQASACNVIDDIGVNPCNLTRTNDVSGYWVDQKLFARF